MSVYKEEKTNTWRVIYRDTDFTGAKFIIDDSEVPDNQRGVAIFPVAATKPT